MTTESNKAENEKTVSGHLKRGVIGADYDFNMPSCISENNACSEARRSHRMKRLDKYETRCINAGCDKAV